MKKELSELERKKLLKKNHHQKIDYALAKAFINDSDVYKLVKDFFADYLNLDYEFTHEELVVELNKKFIEENLKMEISTFLSKLSHLQFNTDKHPSQEELKNIITSFKYIISKLIVFEESHRKSFFSRIFSKLSGNNNKKQKQQEKYKKKDSPENIKESKLQKKDTEKNEILQTKKEPVEMANGILNGQQNMKKSFPESLKTGDEIYFPESPHHLIQKVEKNLKLSNIQAARQSYKNLISSYNKLSDQEKHKYFQKINELYSNIIQLK